MIHTHQTTITDLLEETGVVLALSRPLTAEEITTFQMSAFDSENTIVNASELALACEALERSGFTVIKS